MLYKKLNNDPLLCYLNDEEIKEISSIRSTEKYQKGELIFNVNDRNRDIFIIKSGLIGVQVQQKIIAQLREGDIIGEVNFVLPVRRTASCLAIEETLLYRFVYHDVIEFIKNKPGISSKLFAAINSSLEKKLNNTIKGLDK